MFIRCPKCDALNNPDYRFCGMCGGSLASNPPRAATTETREVDPVPAPPVEDFRPSVAGPSFLGLTEPSNQTTYLLEDEPSSRRWVAYLVILLLLVGGSVLAWRWRSEGYAWRELMSNHRLLGNSANTSSSDSNADATGQSQAKPDEAAQNSAPPTSEAASPAPTGNREAQATPPPQATPPQTTEKAAPNAPTSVAENREIPKPPDRQTSSPKANDQPGESANRSSRDDDERVTEGKNYLYGTGVRPDCTRARTNLMSAAEEDNVEAQRLLGAMYATGHCVSVDLPTAYRWLARAQRQEPRHPLVASTLRMVWTEMTAEQQHAATNSAR